VQIERDKQFVEEELMRTRGEKTETDRSILSSEQNVNEMRLQISQLQQVLDEKEQAQSQK